MASDPDKQETINRIRGRLKAREKVLAEVLPGESAWHDGLSGRVLPVVRIERKRGRITLHVGPEWFDVTTCPLNFVRVVEGGCDGGN